MGNVRCYAGASYPERPVEFEWEGRLLEVVETKRQERTPEGLVFDVLAEDGRRYRLGWDARDDEWAIMSGSDTPEDGKAHRNDCKEAEQCPR